MILLKLLPGVLKELTRHVPTVFFQVIDWSEIASEVPRLSKRVIQKEGFQDFFQKQKSFLAPAAVKMELHSEAARGQDFSKETGIQLLELYFAQLFSPHGLFLDLRPQNFSAGNNVLTWYPTGTWTTLHSDFRMGILNVYEGFYLGDNEKYRQGLVEVGLMDKDWPEADKQKLADLFREQFGDANTEEVTFTLDHFNDSMTRMFHFILQKKRKITVDFLYLGIYLVTLYASLEKTGTPLPVKEVYLTVRKTFKDEA